MKIIQVNKFLYPKGGADKYCLSLIEELDKLGHEAIPYAMADDKNISSKYASYFSEHIDYHHPRNRIKAALRLIWNKEAAKKFGELLDSAKPDIIHCHNIYHQLSPSILKEGEKRNIPIVMTLHDYKLICPNYKMFNHGHVCELCLRGNYLNCFKNRCYNSYSQSALASLESWLHNKVWKTYKNNIDIFISPSQFLKDKMIQGGWNPDKIVVLNNPADNFLPSPAGDRLLYFGRLATEKGVDSLIKALPLTDEKLDIVGSGAEEKRLKEMSRELGLEDRISFYGNKKKEELDKFIANSKAVLLPSIWNENMPLSVLEALSKGKIVIASKTGGTPEIIEDGKTGFLFLPNNIQEMAAKIKNLNSLGIEQIDELRENIKLKIQPLNLEFHLQKLLNIYESLKNR